MDEIYAGVLEVKEELITIRELLEVELERQKKARAAYYARKKESEKK